MDRASLEQHLAQAERHVAEGFRHIHTEHALIIRMESKGHDTTTAEEFLSYLLETQNLCEQDVARLRLAMSKAQG
jgi:hypothetical protein